MNKKHDLHDLIPIVMFDETSHWMEYICVTNLQDCADIGIALRDMDRHAIRIAGIHLDKQMILEQHQLVSWDIPQCLDGFIIDDMNIGNADDLLNKVKDYAGRYVSMKEFLYWCRNDEEMKQSDRLQQQVTRYCEKDNGKPHQEKNIS
eukprot:856423_1